MRRYRHEQGVALVLVVFFALVVGGIAVSYSAWTFSEARAQTSHGDSIRALAAADAGLNELLENMRADPPGAGENERVLEGTMQQVPWAARAVRVDANTWELTAVGRAGNIRRGARMYVAEQTVLDQIMGDSALSIVGNVTKKGKIALHVKHPRDSGRGREDADGHDDDEDATWTSQSTSPVAIDGTDRAGRRNVPGVGIEDARVFQQTAERWAREIARGKIPADAILGDPMNEFTSRDGRVASMSLARLADPQIDYNYLTSMADMIVDALEANVLPRANRVVSGNDARITGTVQWGTPASPEVTVIDARQLSVQPDAVIRGAGTLIVQGDVRILNRARLEWTGDIIVLGGTNNRDADLRNQNGSLVVNGNVLVLGADDRRGNARFSLHDNNSEVNDAVNVINGSVLAISGQRTRKEDKATITIKTGDTTITGVLAVAGDKVKLDVKDHRDRRGVESYFRLYGTAVVAVPDNDERHKVKVHIHGDNILLQYDSQAVSNALAGLQSLAGVSPDASRTDLRVTAWMEVPWASTGLEP
jgi:hypothetical protein